VAGHDHATGCEPVSDFLGAVLACKPAAPARLHQLCGSQLLTELCQLATYILAMLVSRLKPLDGLKQFSNGPHSSSSWLSRDGAQRVLCRSALVALSTGRVAGALTS